jgi:hypothetical protein
MNDLTSVNDDSLDEVLRSALLQIDRGPALIVDVEEVLRRGARHRRVVALERVGAVAAVALVVAGAGGFALSRTTLEPSPVPPATSVTPAPSHPAVVVAPVMIAGSSGTFGDPKTRRGLTGVEIDNTGTEATTVSIQSITSPDATVRAVLTQVPPSQEHVLTFDDKLLTSVDRPGPTSVTVPAGQYVVLVMSVEVPSCPKTLAGVQALGDSIYPTVTLSLRSPSGGTGTLDVTQAAGPTGGWVRTALLYACGFPPKS